MANLNLLFYIEKKVISSAKYGKYLLGCSIGINLKYKNIENEEK